jgi:hypothetical protein
MGGRIVGDGGCSTAARRSQVESQDGSMATLMLASESSDLPKSFSMAEERVAERQGWLGQGCCLKVGGATQL